MMKTMFGLPGGGSDRSVKEKGEEEQVR